MRGVIGLALLMVLGQSTLDAQARIQLPARDKLLTEKPSVVFSVGKEDGEPWEILSGVRWVAFDARDHLYVLDGGNHRVLVFDANGRFVRSISQKGQGPGELMAPTGMTVMTDGTIVVSDGGRRAYSLFNSGGTFMRNVLYGDGEGVGGRAEGLRSHPRTGIVTLIYPPRPNGRAVGQPTGDRKVPLKWIDLSSRPNPPVLYVFTMPSITPKVEDRPGRGVSVVTLPANWTPAHTYGVLPSGGVVVADEAAYRIKIVGPTGTVERIIERSIAPRKGTQKDKDAYVVREAESMAQSANMTSRTAPGGTSAGGGGPSREALEQLLKNATWLDVIPVLRRVNADPQGRIWVARTPDDFGTSGPIDIVRADGTYVGTIANSIFPAAVSKSGRAAFIERDELGVERVTVKQLPAVWR
jgi:hypothetical protein